jgi:hypothetical protein
MPRESGASSTPQRSSCTPHPIGAREYRIAWSSRATTAPLNLPSFPLYQDRQRQSRPFPAARRSHEVIVAITLQSTVGGFSPEFMRKLPDLEQAMVAHGLEPSQFIISKDWATPATAPFIGPFFYDYTVFVGGRISPSPSRTTSGSWIIFTSAASRRTRRRRSSRADAPA